MEIVFIETTIVSYLVSRPSRDLVLAAHQTVTRNWWEGHRRNYHCVTSDEVVREARLGDPEMARRRIELLGSIETFETTSAMRTAAAQLLLTGALPPEMTSDALHLAAAMLADADYLLTWNCRHLANAHVLRRMEKEAVKLGRVLPTVCTPLELVGE